MASRTPEQKIGSGVLRYVSETVEALANSHRRSVLFRPGHNKGNRYVAKVQRADLVEYIREYHKGNLKYSTDQVKRALSYYVDFLPVKNG